MQFWGSKSIATLPACMVSLILVSPITSVVGLRCREDRGVRSVFFSFFAGCVVLCWCYVGGGFGGAGWPKGENYPEEGFAMVGKMVGCCKR